MCSEVLGLINYFFNVEVSFDNTESITGNFGVMRLLYNEGSKTRDRKILHWKTLPSRERFFKVKFLRKRGKNGSL